MKKVMVVTITAVVLSISPIALAWAGCGGCVFNSNAGYGGYGFQEGSIISSCCSAASYIQSAASRCCAGVLDFFKGSTNPTVAPGAARAQAY